MNDVYLPLLPPELIELTQQLAFWGAIRADSIDLPSHTMTVGIALRIVKKLSLTYENQAVVVLVPGSGMRHITGYRLTAPEPQRALERALTAHVVKNNCAADDVPEVNRQRNVVSYRPANHLAMRALMMVRTQVPSIKTVSRLLHDALGGDFERSQQFGERQQLFSEPVDVVVLLVPQRHLHVAEKICLQLDPEQEFFMIAAIEMAISDLANDD